MNESFEILLNGMPLKEFWVWYLVAMAGALVYLLIRIEQAIRKDPNTPSTFSWRHTARGFIKLIIAMIIIPWGIIYFSDILPILLNFITTDALLPEGVELNAEVNGFSAFLIGFGVDYLVRRTMTAAKKLNEKRK